MPKRRKFLAGVGALVSGSAAAVGTGALSSVEAERSVNADVVTDANGTLGIQLDAPGLENSNKALMNNGQLELQFDGADSTGGTFSSSSGLNADSTYHFDNVFQLVNRSSDDVIYEWDKSQLDNPGAFNFYAAYPNGGPVIGSRDSDFSAQNNSGQALNIGVTIRTPDSVTEDWETGTLVIRADNPDDSNIN